MHFFVMQPPENLGESPNVTIDIANDAWDILKMLSFSAHQKTSSSSTSYIGSRPLQCAEHGLQISQKGILQIP